MSKANTTYQGAAHIIFSGIFPLGLSFSFISGEINSLWLSCSTKPSNKSSSQSDLSTNLKPTGILLTLTKLCKYYEVFCKATLMHLIDISTDVDRYKWGEMMYSFYRVWGSSVSKTLHLETITHFLTISLAWLIVSWQFNSYSFRGKHHELSSVLLPSGTFTWWTVARSSHIKLAPIVSASLGLQSITMQTCLFGSAHHCWTSSIVPYYVTYCAKKMFFCFSQDIKQ